MPLPHGGSPYLSVIVPAFNESGCIGSTIANIRTALAARGFTWELVVVDDGSTDDSVAIARTAAGGDQRIAIVAAPHGGKGAAVRRGILQVSGQWRLVADADLSTSIEQVDAFLAAIVPGETDIVIGSREAAGAVRVDEPWYRHAIGRLFNWIVQAAVFRGIDDTQCGFKLFRAEAAEWLFARQRIDGFGFDVELLYLARRGGFAVRQVPVIWTYDDSSNVTVSAGLAGFVDIFRVRWNALRGAYDRRIAERDPAE